jgi:hypothetical protein
MKLKIVQTLFLVSIVIMFIAVFLSVRDIYREQHFCDVVVFVEGELSIDASSVTYYSDTMCTIEACDGDILHIPNRKILRVISKQTLE